jgi:hypothetical protein
MPFAASCPHCQKQYQLPEQLVGKTVKCKECRQDFQVGNSSLVAQTAAAGAGGQTARPAGRVPAGNAAGASELSRFGLDGPIVRPSTDIFADSPQPPRSGDPLGNFANEDPGFAGSATHGKPSKKTSQPLAPPSKAAPIDSAAKAPFDNPYASAAANLRKAAKPKTADIQKEFDRLDRVAKNHNTMMLAFLGGIGTRVLFTLILIGIQFFTGFYIQPSKPNFGLPDHLLYTLAGVEGIATIISLVTAIMLLVSIFKLASNLYPGTRSNILHLVLFFIPLGVLFSLLSLDRAARAQLRAAGYTVGLMGVKNTP